MSSVQCVINILYFLAFCSFNVGERIIIKGLQRLWPTVRCHRDAIVKIGTYRWSKFCDVRYTLLKFVSGRSKVKLHTYLSLYRVWLHPQSWSILLIFFNGLAIMVYVHENDSMLNKYDNPMHDFGGHFIFFQFSIFFLEGATRLIKQLFHSRLLDARLLSLFFSA